MFYYHFLLVTHLYKGLFNNELVAEMNKNIRPIIIVIINGNVSIYINYHSISTNKKTKQVGYPLPQPQHLCLKMQENFYNFHALYFD